MGGASGDNKDLFFYYLKFKHFPQQQQQKKNKTATQSGICASSFSSSSGFHCLYFFSLSSSLVLPLWQLLLPAKSGCRSDFLHLRVSIHADWSVSSWMEKYSSLKCARSDCVHFIGRFSSMVRWWSNTGLCACPLSTSAHKHHLKGLNTPFKHSIEAHVRVRPAQRL